MEAQFEYINTLAVKYEEYNKKPDLLFKDVNQLDLNILKEVKNEYDDPERKFQPVRLLRAEIAKYLMEGNDLDEEKIEAIKEDIRSKKLDKFSGYSKEFLDQLKAYTIGKRDVFANWQRHWTVLHPFIYRGKIRETTNQYLDQISQQLIKDLNLTDYDSHTVDFYGSSNFGDTRCWIALYPFSKQNHRESYQLFLSISHSPSAGILTGDGVKNDYRNDLENVGSYAEVLKVLQSNKEEVLSLNKKLRNYFKFAPGPQASEWEYFKNSNIGAVNYSDLSVGDISGVQNFAELNLRAGFSEDSSSNLTWNLWCFKTANQGDVVFATKGVNTSLGIGIIEGEYEFDNEKDKYQHKRKVKWITDKIYQYKPNSLKGYKTLFRPDTFSPTKAWEFILSEYIRLYPELKSIFDNYNLQYKENSTTEVSEDQEIYEAESEDDANYWWLNANPSIWSISKVDEGTSQTYTTRNERGNKRRIYKHFEGAKPGDLMIGYESSPVKQVKAIFEITKGIHNKEEKGEVIEFELIEKLDIPVDWSELQDLKGLEDCEVFINNQGSLFKLTEEEFDIIRDAIDAKNIAFEKEKIDQVVPVYDYLKDPDKPFIPFNQIQQIINLLENKKNIILQGPPGVGKTFVAKRLAYQMMGQKNDGQIEMVQFHQSYSYEDFIQGLRPAKNGVFKRKNGVFFNFCKLAHSHPEKPFFFIIDEINRGNLSKIFGEMMMLLESDKRSKTYELKLTYAEDEGETFHIPENLYLIGTMNTADRSLALVDYALRRRFAFINLKPSYDGEFKDFLLDKGLPSSFIDQISKAVKDVNRHITNDQNLGEGFQIGHSYFCNYQNSMPPEEWYKQIVAYEIEPLLEEIWFDNHDKVQEMMKILNVH